MHLLVAKKGGKQGMRNKEHWVSDWRLHWRLAFDLSLTVGLKC